MVVTKTEFQRNNKVVKAITFKIEELSLPDKLLEEENSQHILAKFSTKIAAHSEIKKSLVSNGFHPFLYGMYQAYSAHRPFVMSPDMIWLLICQGFSNHINFSTGTANEVFPHLNTKQTLTIIKNADEIVNKTKFWAESTKQFTDEISKHVGKKLIDILRADFTTTGATERVASEITIMDAMKPYFEYILVVFICGIPEITLEGTTDDWKKILTKLSDLRKYNLAWWIDELVPILKEFSAASTGDINKHFWMNMFKVHTDDSYGNPESFDGWILSFFPYDRKGNLINLKNNKRLSVAAICDDLPKEITCVDFKYRTLDETGKILEEISMEYWAGFIGLSQNQENYAVRPEIAWLVCHKTDKISNNTRHPYETTSRKYYNLTSFPLDLFKQKKWDVLVLNFKGNIEIPIKILNLSIDFLELNGKLLKKDKWKIFLLKKKIDVRINGED